MKTIAALNPGEQIVLPAVLSVARVGPRRKPMLRLSSLHPVTLEKIAADMDAPPPTLGFALEVNARFDGDTRPVYLTPAEGLDHIHRPVLDDFRAKLRRWRIEGREAGWVPPAPKYTDKADDPILGRRWTT